MGQGGTITLVNGTTYDWTKSHEHSYQMNSWNFPDQILAGKSATVYVEWDQYIFHNQGDDAGEARYTLGNTDLSIEVQARSGESFNLQVDCNQIGLGIQNLGWIHDGNVSFVLSGMAGCFNSPVNWMQANLGILGTRTLRQLCMPGSHDAGMSIRTGGTALTADCNTLTQTVGIKRQLECGSRYFDIRPVITAGNFATGHYSKIGPSWQGANGQTIDSIVEDVNLFLDENKELIFLYLSHDLNTDVGNSSYRPFDQGEWNSLLDKLSNSLHYLYKNNSSVPDLSLLSLNDFIGNGVPAVVVIVDSGTPIDLGKYENQGFFKATQFSLYNQYSNTNDLSTMVTDQLAKLSSQRTSPNSPLFLLSWTLTQDATQAAGCMFDPTGTTRSILDLASIANQELYKQLPQHCSAQSYPNVIYIDAFDNPNTGSLAMAINLKAQPT